MKTITYFPVCPFYHVKSEVKILYRESKNRYDPDTTLNYPGYRCRLCQDHYCPLIDAPCVPKNP